MRCRLEGKWKTEQTHCLARRFVGVARHRPPDHVALVRGAGGLVERDFALQVQVKELEWGWTGNGRV